MFWLHLGELFLLAWLIIGMFAVVWRQRDIHDNVINAMLILYCITRKFSVTVAEPTEGDEGFEYFFDNRPTFIYGDKPGDFRPMPRPDDNRPADVQ